MKYLVVVLALALGGCAIPIQADRSVQKEFTFDYQLPGKSKDELWESAQGFFTTTYGDSREVIHVQDKEQGKLIGKALVRWSLFSSNCLSSYHIRFAAKDDKARLQLELIDAIPAGTACTGWSWPSVEGHKQIVSSFNKLSVDLDSALNSGSKIDEFMNF